MNQVDQVTQRNAAAAEELSGTAAVMATQAEQLQELVTMFRATENSSSGARLSPASVVQARAQTTAPSRQPGKPLAGGERRGSFAAASGAPAPLPIRREL
jgi:methyl-accepting chemotaxis protein